MSLPVEKNKKIIIIGDIMLDKLYYGALENTSKEDPLAKILKVKDTSDNLGGAGNVAANIKSMCSHPYLLGVITNDDAGKRIEQLCENLEIDTKGLFVDNTRPTTTKSRLYDGDQVIRFDQEVTTEISQDLQNKIITSTENLIKEKNIDGIILQDYNKGVLTKQLINAIISIATEASIPIFVDPKKENFFEYKNVTLFKPNEREIKWSLPGCNFESAAQNILTQLQSQYAVITLAEKGMYLASKDESHLSPASADQIVDVCGAGDTVISILALTHLSKCNMKQMTAIANLAAANVCQHKGVTPIKYQALVDLYQSHYQDSDILDIA